MRSSAAQCRSGAPTPITMLSLRDLGAAIVTAAGCGAWWGVGKFSAWLSASTPASLAGVTLARWQWVNVAAFAVNVVSVAIPGRIDDEMATQMKKEAKIRKSPRSVASGVPKDSIYRSLVTPAGWAFLIWPVIYLAESVFTAAQASSSLDQISAAAYASAAPWWALSCTLQALWCVAFRDWAKAPSHFWISGSLLVAESVSLGKAVAAMDAAKVAFPSAAYLCGRLPLALHHGWITAAAVVNVNSWIAVSENYPSRMSNAEFQARSAFISHAAAAFVGARVSWSSRDRRSRRSSRGRCTPSRRTAVGGRGTSWNGSGRSRCGTLPTTLCFTLGRWRRSACAWRPSRRWTPICPMRWRCLIGD